MCCCYRQMMGIALLHNDLPRPRRFRSEPDADVAYLPAGHDHNSATAWWAVFNAGYVDFHRITFSVTTKDYQ